jgi:hypothetical protein
MNLKKLRYHKCTCKIAYYMCRHAKNLVLSSRSSTGHFQTLLETLMGSGLFRNCRAVHMYETICNNVHTVHK